MPKPVVVFLISSPEGSRRPLKICPTPSASLDRERLGLENESRILADLANAYRLNGDTATALTTVDEAIKVATERHARVPECLARIVRADLLLRSATSDQKAEGRQELERARALMRETGAMLLQNFIDDVEHRHTRQISIKVS